MVLHLHYDSMGVLRCIWSMYIGIWDNKIVATDGSALLWHVIHQGVLCFRMAGCCLVLHWVRGHTAGQMDLHLGQDLCNTLCDTLWREDWVSLLEGPTAFTHNFNVVLWDNECGQCSETILVWLKGSHWKVLAAMREKMQENALSWELTWQAILDMVTGPKLVLLSPVALGSQSNG